MNHHFSNSDIEKYLQILAYLNEKHAKIFTLKELSELFNVSVRKLVDFKKGRVIDFGLLTQYAGIVGYEIDFSLKSVI